MTWYFLFFFLSGFCGILYEIVWLRLSMAQFGVTSALVAVVLSTFMAGLGVGSWASGRLVRSYGTQAGVLSLRLYAVIELLIGISALLVPLELRRGRILLESAGLPSSGTYYLASGLWIALTFVPWCACMGATIPLAMASIKNEFRSKSSQSFSYLYLANVMGAAVGAIVPLFLIELYGFHGTLKIGAALNGILAVSAFALATRIRSPRQAPALPSDASAEMYSSLQSSRRPLTLLFATGLTSMGMEVVWIRQFTPYLGTMVYAFAVILALYLLSTSIGSQVYRQWSRRNTGEPQALWLALGFGAFLSLAAGDPHFRIFIFLRPVIGIVPFSAVLGFITPMLVDRWSQGNPDRAGTAYATNVLGCILGPLLSGFLLLPFTSEHSVVCIFALPWLIFGMNLPWLFKIERPKQSIVSYAVALLALVLAVVSKDFESRFSHYEVFRDNAATVVATSEGGTKKLLVNGIGMTSLTAVTKIMAHLPMASLNHKPQNALTICFGMGTTFRSFLSWEVPTTAVELVPSVPRVFGFYHADGPQLLQSPLAHLVVDDGRRYLERTTDQYDVITLDPPPPVESAGSGMLYSKEFYAVINQRLRPDGILQQWLPEGDAVVRSAVARAIYESFPHVRVFQYSANWGFQFLASQQPIPDRTGAEMVARMPSAAVRDLMEWPLAPSAEQELNLVLRLETSMVSVLDADPTVGAMQDDHPVNEYVILRNLKRSRFQGNYIASWYEHTKNP
jgi:predicted membrane-bound spermidine synthase